VFEFYESDGVGLHARRNIEWTALLANSR